MKLKGIGEDRLVADLTAGLTGIGDDCAVESGLRAGWNLLLKTDAVVEGIHFLEGTPGGRVGWKAMARPLSDIAAMGGVPLHALVTIACEATRDVAYLKALYGGIRKAADRFDVRIVGGETSRSPGPLFVSVALTGEVERSRCVYRSGGKPGDVIFVTGRLGGTLAEHHLTFRPRIEEARWLTERFRIHAMMDLSDGLGADLPRMALASGTDFKIDGERVPCRRGRTLEEALGDGEDYELLFAVASGTARRIEAVWPEAFPRVPLTRVGRLVEHGSVPGKEWVSGYDHFA